MKIKYNQYWNISITRVYTGKFFMMRNELGNTLNVAFNTLGNSIGSIALNQHKNINCLYIYRKCVI